VDKSVDRLCFLDSIFGSKITTVYSDKTNLATLIGKADLVIGSVLIPGEIYTRNEWKRVKFTLETSGKDVKFTLETSEKDVKFTLETSEKDVKIHSKRVGKM
jgi:hypothetical protein